MREEKLLSVIIQHALGLEPAERPAHGAAVDGEIIRELLPVKAERKSLGAGARTLGVQKA